MQRIPVLAACLLLSSNCFGQPYPTAQRGIGSTSCSLYLKRYGENAVMADFMFFTWAQGWMTAANEMLIDTNSKTRTYRDLSGSIDEQEAQARAFCEMHPLGSYEDAVRAVYKGLPLMQIE